MFMRYLGGGVGHKGLGSVVDIDDTLRLLGVSLPAAEEEPEDIETSAVAGDF